MSGDPEQEYFADRIVKDIITALARCPSLFVVARNSCFTYKGRAVDVKQVGCELGVRYVLESTLRKAGNLIRVTPSGLHCQDHRRRLLVGFASVDAPSCRRLWPKAMPRCRPTAGSSSGSATTWATSS
jgi:TolB-like protein